jgi:chemotaxis response regulator CheB
VRIGLAHASLDTLRALEQALAPSEHDVAWIARTGQEAREKAAVDKPDLVLLDVGIADPSCVEATRQLVQDASCAVLLLVDRPDAKLHVVYEAMGLGALDVVTAPTLRADRVNGEAALLAKLGTVRKVLGLKEGPRRSQQPRKLPRRKLVAIGASTGGPQALAAVLSGLPRDFSAALIIVQHVDSEFSTGLADWLTQSTNVKVELATPGVLPTPGMAWLAGTNDHLVLTRSGMLQYTPEPREVAYRPSVDALFHSLAQHWPTPAVAVLLTGMGRDGARGMKALRDAGWHTIAQDEATSVVYGMPKAAADLGAATHVVPLSQIAAAIVDACR